MRKGGLVAPQSRLPFFFLASQRTKKVYDLVAQPQLGDSSVEVGILTLWMPRTYTPSTQQPYWISSRKCIFCNLRTLILSVARQWGPVTANPLSHPNEYIPRKSALYSAVMFDSFVHLQSAIKIFLWTCNMKMDGGTNYTSVSERVDLCF